MRREFKICYKPDTKALLDCFPDTFPAMRIQVDQALSNIEVALRSVGGQMGDVTELFQHTTDIDVFMQTGDIRQKYLSEPYPVTTTVEVVRLYYPELVVEITASAEIPLDRYHLAN